MTENPIDKCARLLHILGWSTGEIAYSDAQRHVWQVHAHREGQNIIARAPTQTAAWEAATRQAGIVQREVM